MKIMGIVKNGLFSNQAYLSSCFRNLDGKNITLRITKTSKKRTLPQNAYLWSTVYPLIAEFIGDTAEGVHESMGEMFLRYQDKHGLWKVRSTTSLEPEQFWNYVEQARMWASSFLNIYIPDPEKKDKS